jgi:hypothetical protein
MCHKISTSKYFACLFVSHNSHELFHISYGINFKTLIYLKYEIIFAE